MIQVRTDEHLLLEVTGHAGYAEKGKDIICAAISVLYETLKLALEETCGVENPEVKPGLIRLNSADLKVVQWSVAPTLIESFALGMKQIAVQYPEYVAYFLL